MLYIRSFQGPTQLTQQLACCRSLQKQLAAERSTAQADAEAAAAELAGAKQAAAEDVGRLQEEITAKEQKLAEAVAIQEDLAVRLQVGQAWPEKLVKFHEGAGKGQSW